MIPAQKPANETERLAALHEYNILDTIPEKEYDDITKIAADICGTPISLLTIVDAERQWFKSRIGLTDTETKRELAFCAHAILEPEELFMVRNATEDARFFDNPLVTGSPHIAFYAGVPLVNESGNALGTLCVIDNKPKDLSVEQKATLNALARQIVAHFETRKANMHLQLQQLQLEQVNNDLSRFAHVVAHDIKSPCSSLAMGIAMIRDNYMQNLDKEGILFLNLLEETSLRAICMVNGILEHTQTVNKSKTTKEHFTFGTLISELKKLIVIPPGFTLETNDESLELFTSRYILLQILLNLCNNAIKYNKKSNGLVFLTASASHSVYHFSVKDNGPGIALTDQKKIFDLFSTLGNADRYNHQGTGIGLATVKRLVEKMDGIIEVNSSPGLGSSFDFTLSK